MARMEGALAEVKDKMMNLDPTEVEKTLTDIWESGKGLVSPASPIMMEVYSLTAIAALWCM